MARFVDAGPATDDEFDACYRLALLFESHEFPENAAACYRKILAVRPGYRDTPDRLRAAETDYRGTAAKDYERVFKEELAFRQAAKRSEAPLAAAAPEMGALADLPEMPDLPDLPAPPAPSGVKPGQTLRVATRLGLPGVVLEEGTLVNGRYRLEKKIGQGGMGTVWKATDQELDESIAIKFLTGQLDEEALGRFRQEVSLSRHFNHPNIIRLYDIGTYADQKYITMELLSGHDLKELMQRVPLDFDRGLALLVQACHALQVVHEQGVIHRDIKPDNFFITDKGVLKVMDFGIAKRRSAGRGLTRAGMMAGTPQYMAPEQANNFGGVTHLADIYALGCIAYQMFTGAVPFDAEEVVPILIAHMSRAPEPPRQRNPTIPAELETVILKLLAKQPEARVQSCRELAAILSSIRLRLPS